MARPATNATIKRTLKKKLPVFLKKLAEIGNVTLSAKYAKLTRTIVYRERERNPAFLKAWDKALEEASDILEAEAWRRSMKGTLKPVFYQGVECGQVREYSDTLLTLLLKANRPKKFRENLNLSSSEGLAVNISRGDEQAEKARQALFEDEGS